MRVNHLSAQYHLKSTWQHEMNIGLLTWDRLTNRMWQCYPCLWHRLLCLRRCGAMPPCLVSRVRSPDCWSLESPLVYPCHISGSCTSLSQHCFLVSFHHNSSMMSCSMLSWRWTNQRSRKQSWKYCNRNMSDDTSQAIHIILGLSKIYRKCTHHSLFVFFSTAHIGVFEHPCASHICHNQLTLV